MNTRSSQFRDSKGRFVAIKEGVEDAFNIFYIILKLIPALFLIMFILNHYRAWDVLKNYTDSLLNIGNPDCKMICEVKPSKESGF